MARLRPFTVESAENAEMKEASVSVNSALSVVNDPLVLGLKAL